MAAKKKTKYRHYSDDFIAAAFAVLKANKGDMNKTAREMKVPRTTLQKWVKRGARPLTPEKVIAAEVNMQDELKQLVAKVCRLDIASVDVAGLNLRDCFVGMGIAVDKILVLQGQPNTIHRNETGGKYDLSRLSPEQLRAFADIADVAAGKPIVEDASDLKNPVLVPWAEPDEPEPAADQTAEEQTA